MTPVVAAFDVRAWLADELDCEPEELAAPAGPRASGRGQEAEYLRRGCQAATVLIAWGAPNQYGRPMRVISIVRRSRSHVGRLTL